MEEAAEPVASDDLDVGVENSVSNVGGTTWYGQNKITQGLAKDAFDAINNQVANLF